MRVGITLSDDKPVMSIGSLEGTIIYLWGRMEHMGSKDPRNDALSTWFSLFIVQEGNSWKQSNCKYTRDQDQRIINNTLAKAKRLPVLRHTAKSVISTPDWAAVPLDPGTREVIENGLVVLYERGKLLSQHLR